MALAAPKRSLGGASDVITNKNNATVPDSLVDDLLGQRKLLRTVRAAFAVENVVRAREPSVAFATLKKGAGVSTVVFADQSYISFRYS